MKKQQEKITTTREDSDPDQYRVPEGQSQEKRARETAQEDDFRRNIKFREGPARE